MRMRFSILIWSLIFSVQESVTQDELDADVLISSYFNNEQPSTQQPSTQQPSSTKQPSSTEQDCKCVPYYQCSENRTVIDDGAGLIDIRIKPESCDNYLEQCCESGAVLVDSVSPTPPTITATYSTCGQRNPQGVSSLRITGDVDGESQFGEFPWMIAVTSKQQVEGSSVLVSVYQCGGSLISPNVVLTAAHCVSNKTGLSVRAGEWDTQTNNEPLPLQISAVKEVVVHEQFNSRSLHNDVALLILEKAMELGPHIRTICLPAQDENMDERNCLASGWGKDVFGKEGRYQVILKKIELKTVPHDKCLEALRKTRLGHRFKLHESFICAGGERGKDTCQGDGGGPLVCPSSTDPQVYVQAGIVAWGISCGSETPAVYVNVGHFSNWIENKIMEYNIDPRLD